MDWSALHFHLMLNHIPVLGTVAAALVLVWGVLRKSAEITSLGLTATAIIALLTVPVYLTGEPAEDRLRELDRSVDRRLIHQHEEKAEVGFIAVLITGAVAIGALWRGRRGAAGRGLPLLVCAGLLISFGLFASAAIEGGEIRHPELRPDHGVAPPAPLPR